MKRVMYTQIKYFESGTRELYVKLKKKEKDSFDPDSNQRPKDINSSPTVLRSTN